MADVFRMGLEDRLGAVLHKAAPLLPGDVGRHLLALVSPGSLAIMAGVVVVWATSHFLGVGEIADVALLIVAHDRRERCGGLPQAALVCACNAFRPK